MGLERFIEHQRVLARAAEEKRKADAQSLRLRFPDLIRELRSRGAVLIVLFGSLARGEVDEASDVDVAVEGLPLEAFFDAMSSCWTAMRRPVDLVRLEEAAVPLKQRILNDGEVLFDGCG